MGKAKIASKNNPEGRGRAKVYEHNGKVIVPVKLISAGRTFLAAEYKDSGELLVDQAGSALPWGRAKNLG